MIFNILMIIVVVLVLFGILISNRTAFIKAVEEPREYKELTVNSPRDIVFISYRANNIQLADKVRKLLELNQFTVRMWNPEEMFDDPVGTIFYFVDEASVFIAILPADHSDWIDAERRLAAVTKTGIIEVHTEQDLESLSELVEKEAALARPFSVFPGDMADTARSVFSKLPSEIVSKSRLPEYSDVGFYAGAGAFLSLFVCGIAFYLAIIALILRYFSVI